MTCSHASQISLLAPQKSFSSSPAGGHCIAQPAASPLSRGAGGNGLLPAGQALTLQARQAGVLRIVQGRAWITFSHAEKDLHTPAGDHFCGAGDALQLAAGDAVVMESWGRNDEPLACFSWESASPGSAMPGLALAGSRMNVLQPLQDLQLAMGLAAAAVQLVRGLVQRTLAKVAAVLR